MDTVQSLYNAIVGYIIVHIAVPVVDPWCMVAFTGGVPHLWDTAAAHLPPTNHIRN